MDGWTRRHGLRARGAFPVQPLTPGHGRVGRVVTGLERTVMLPWPWCPVTGAGALISPPSC